jgi:ComF family protein
MSHLIDWIGRLRTGLANVVFPNVCLACGERVLKEGQHICSFCLDKRFALALSKDKMSSAGVILPQSVKLQQALWEFDRGGVLQRLIHHLKYQQLMDVGVQLGEVFARKIKDHCQIHSILDTSEAVLLPVPLHYLKFRRRGFNQAFTIAQGMKSILDIPICSIKAVVRRNNTPSQTGLSLQERQENMRDVFKVRREHEISKKVVIIVDDVFTTGATSFELAKTVTKAGATSVMIWTIAQA